MTFWLVNFLTNAHTSQKMKGISCCLLAIVLCLCMFDIEAKSSKKGSKVGKSGNPCFEFPSECTDRMKSAKGSQPSMAFEIWCKEGETEKCIAGEPKSHSIERYQRGRCPFCSLVYSPTFFGLLHFGKVHHATAAFSAWRAHILPYMFSAWRAHILPFHKKKGTSQTRHATLPACGPPRPSSYPPLFVRHTSHPLPSINFSSDSSLVHAFEGSGGRLSLYRSGGRARVTHLYT